MADTLGDHYNMLAFAQGELRASIEALAVARQEAWDHVQIMRLEHEIDLLEQAVDRHQKQIKILHNQNP